MLKTAVRLFLEEAEKMGTLEDILREAGFKKDSTGRWLPPKLVAFVIRSNLTTAGISREECFSLLEDD